MGKDRVVYMDVAKGVCMLLVVMIHTGVPEPLPHLFAAKVVLFFLLSGYFYHDDMPWDDFLMKKVRTLLVPFLVFYVASYALYYLMLAVKPSFTALTEARGILDCFTQKQYFNGPLWFLLSIFEIQLMVFAIRTLVRKELLRWCMYAATVWGGYFLASKNIDLPCNLDTSLTVVVFFAAGHEIRKINLLESLGSSKCLVASLLGYVLFCIFPVQCYASVNRYGCDNAVELFAMLLVLSMSILLLCKALAAKMERWLGVFSYVGRHTMWILCVHHLVYRPVKILCSMVLGGHATVSALVVFLVTMALCLATAPYVERKMPWALGK